MESKIKLLPLLEKSRNGQETNGYNGCKADFPNLIEMPYLTLETIFKWSKFNEAKWVKNWL